MQEGLVANGTSRQLKGNCSPWRARSRLCQMLISWGFLVPQNHGIGSSERQRQSVALQTSQEGTLNFPWWWIPLWLTPGWGLPEWAPLLLVLFFIYYIYIKCMYVTRTHTYTPTIFGDLWTTLASILSSTGWVPGIHPVQLGSKQLYPFSLVQNKFLMEAAEFKKPPGIIFPYLPTHVLGSEIRDAPLGLIPH